MSTTEASYTVSTNIERDTHNRINYITTPNTLNVFNRLVFGFQTGQHSFNIIGSYGTGKSTFLWALEKNLRQETAYFAPVNGQFGASKQFHFIKIVGEATSLRTIFKERLKIDADAKDNKIFQALGDIYSDLQHDNTALVIVIDEFGKFLEYAAKYNPEKELYFIQQLAEFVNDPGKNILLLTTLHQNFSTYAKGLSKDQKKEWEKVKGRLSDISFDEPIEQLLFLAAKRIQEFSFSQPPEDSFNALFDLINESRLINNAPVLDKALARDLYPLDYLSAYILTNALQRYGQNERSLFTFLASLDTFSLQKFDTNLTPYYNIPNVFEYLTQTLSQELNDRDNPHKPTWKAMYAALDKADAYNDEHYEQLKHIIQCIGLINIFGKQSGLLDEKILAAYLYHTVGIENAKELIQSLIQQKIIKFFNHKNKLFFLEGTDVDIEKELIEASSRVNPAIDIVERLKYHLQLLYVPAKRIQYEIGTPRFFKYRITDQVAMESPIGEVDGYINVVLSEEKLESAILSVSEESSEAQVFVYLDNLNFIKQTIFEIEKINLVIKKFPDDKVAKKILLSELNFETNKLKNLLEEDIYSKQATWIILGEKVSITSKNDLNIQLSRLSASIYHDCPHYKNEMVNKEHLSGPILTARKALLKDIFESRTEEKLGYSEDKFPPQKTIYLSLLKATGIHRKIDNQYTLAEPTDTSFQALWQQSEAFLDSAKTIKKDLAEFYELFSKPPFKLKKGFVDFWVPIFLLAREEDFALFHTEQGYIPFLTPEVLDLIHKHPQKHQLKTYKIEGVKVNLFAKYKEITGLQEDDGALDKKKALNSIFANFYRFYKSLPAYTLNTKNLSSVAQGLREAIKTAQNPEEALFDTFPQALGFVNLNLEDQRSLNAYIIKISEAIRDLREAYAEMIGRFEQTLLKTLALEETNFSSYKADVQRRFEGLNPDLLVRKHRQVYSRIMSKLDDREAWLKSVADVIIGKNIEQLLDEEEAVLANNTEHLLKDLESLVELHSLKQERAKDEIYRLEILQADGSKQPTQIILAEKDKAQIEASVVELEKRLTEDKEINKAVLLKLIKKYL